MDRKIIYPAQIPLVEDQLQAARFSQIGIGRIAGALYGEGGSGASGFICTPGAGLAVTIAPGEMIMPGVIDASSYGVLPASSSSLPRQFILTDPVNLSIPSAGATYIVYGTPTTIDTDNIVLPYFNSANPSQTYAGSGNSGASQPTIRADVVTIGIGSVTPSGSVPLWSITVPSGASSITAPMISNATGAPLYPSLDKLASRIVAPFNLALASAFGGYPSKSIVADTSNLGVYWVSTADNNLTTPGASGASWQNLFAPVAAGRLLVRNFFTASTTYTPSAAARQLFIRMIGGGASGSGAVANASGSNNCNCGGAGACGGYAEFWISLALIAGPFQLTVGQGGAGSTSSGASGGATSFGNLVTCQGGGPGQSSGFIVPGRSNFGSQSAGGMVTFNAQTGLYMYLAVTGQNGAGSFVSSSGSSVGQPLPPIGPQSQMGTGGPNGATTDSNITCSSASGYGAGSGAGASLGGGTVTAGNGGNGAIEVVEYT